MSAWAHVQACAEPPAARVALDQLCWGGVVAAEIVGRPPGHRVGAWIRAAVTWGADHVWNLLWVGHRYCGLASADPAISISTASASAILPAADATRAVPTIGATAAST